MGVFADKLTEDINERLHQIVVDRMVKRADDLGVVLTKRQRKKLRRMLEPGSTSTIRIWKWPPWHFDTILLEFDDAEMAELHRELNTELENIESRVRSLVEAAIPEVLEHVRAEYPAQIHDDVREEDAFRARLEKRWRRPLQSLRIIVALAERIAAESRGPDEVELDEEGSAGEWVLRRLHGRGVRVAKEALLLLQSGYADGAMARWRTLHEVTVVALFLQKHGDDCVNRYLAHEAIENQKSAERYRRASVRLKSEPIVDEVWHEIDANARDALIHYGISFGSDYGWATPYLGSNPATFAGIEDSLDLNHLRSLYRTAGHSVHANIKGILFGFGHDPHEVVLLGPSNSGLSEPGRTLGLTLALLSSVLMTLRSNIDVVIAASALSTIASEAADEWISAEDELQREIELSEGGDGD